MSESGANGGLEPTQERGTKESVAEWQKRGHEAILAAAWQMVVDAELAAGRDRADPRMKRDVAGLIRRDQYRTTPIF
mgnify:CR=1 FL=1